MTDNIKYVARVPIVPDDLSNQDAHKNHELVMDFANDDIYFKKDNGYVNITGKIKDEVKTITDGSSIIHLVTEQTLPPVKERSENNWYYVITKAEEAGSEVVSTTKYVYYGLISTYQTSKDYLLIGQNMIDGSDTVTMEIVDGYCPCFYIPIYFNASFANATTGANIEYQVVDRVYAVNTTTGSYVSYDVYTLNLYDAGTYRISINLDGTDKNIVSFDTNEPGIQNLVLPDSISVTDGECIGNIPDPTWDDPRFIFNGWSTNKIAESIIDPTAYKPSENITLFAWFTYNSDPNVIAYYVNNYSSN